MGKPSRATQAKRSRERDKQEKQEEKRVERAQRQQKKKEDFELNGDSNEDPDLAGIIAGPQPIPVWD